MRAIGVRAMHLTDADTPYQIDFSCDAEKHAELLRLEKVKDHLRYRFGNNSIVWTEQLVNKRVSGIDPKENNTIHPVGYLHAT